MRGRGGNFGQTRGPSAGYLDRLGDEYWRARDGSGTLCESGWEARHWMGGRSKRSAVGLKLGFGFEWGRAVGGVLSDRSWGRRGEGAKTKTRGSEWQELRVREWIWAGAVAKS